MSNGSDQLDPRDQIDPSDVAVGWNTVRTWNRATKR
jgi:hypothetical protein